MVAVAAIEGGEHAQDLIVEELDPATTHLILNRPTRRNAFSLDMVQRLAEAVQEASAQGRTAIILSGAGPVFSAGGDVKAARELLAAPERFDAHWEKLMATFAQVVIALQTTPAVTFAALEGAAVGAGLSLALATDVRIAGAGFRFVPGWLERGTAPDGGGSYFLSRHLGPQQMRSLVLHGREIPSASALEHGLVDEVVDDGDALSRCAERAAELAVRSGPALVALRTLADSSTRQGLADQIRLETDLLRSMRKTVQRQEGLSS